MGAPLVIRTKLCKFTARLIRVGNHNIELTSELNQSGYTVRVCQNVPLRFSGNRPAYLKPLQNHEQNKNERIYC